MNTLFLDLHNKKGLSYLTKNSILYHQLKNKINLFIGNKISHDSRYAWITFSFYRGSYFDNENKAGLSHITEHLVSKNLFQLAGLQDCRINASTSPHRITIYLDGPFNFKYIEYGVSKVISSLQQQIFSYSTHKEKLLHDLNIEKEVVKAEIIENNANFKKQIYKNIDKIIFDKANPYNTDSLGTLETLDNITENDIIQVLTEIFSANHLTITGYVEGNILNSKALFKDIRSTFAKFPNFSKTTYAIDQKKYLLYNKSFQPQKRYTKKINLNNKLINISYVWDFDVELFSPEYLTISRLSNLLDIGLYYFTRNKGISYDAFAYISFIGDKRVLITLSINVPKSIYSMKFEQQLTLQINQVFSQLHDDDITAYAHQEILRQKATLISLSRRLYDIEYGLQNYKKIINSDMVQKNYINISIDHYVQWRKKLIETKPTVFIIGDL